MRELEKEQTRDEKIIGNIKLVYYYINKYLGGQRNKNYDDLKSIGTIGLIKAVDTYKPENGTSFSSYAIVCIRNEIFMYFRDIKKLENEVQDVIIEDHDGNTDSKFDFFKFIDEEASSFEHKVENIQASEEAINFILNSSVDERSKGCFLFSLAKITQREIAEIFKISRSYVSRLIKIAQQEIKDNYSETPWNRKFLFKIQGNQYKLSINSFRDPNLKLAKFLSEIGRLNLEDIIPFKIEVRNNRSIITLPGERESLEMIAYLLKNFCE